MDLEMIEQKPPCTIVRFEPIALIFSLALLLTFVPMLISAASTGLNLLGIATVVAFVIWVFKFFQRFANTNF